MDYKLVFSSFHSHGNAESPFILIQKGQQKGFSAVVEKANHAESETNCP